MTYQEVFEMLKEANLPVAFNVFETRQELPYIIFTYPSNNDYMADNINFAEIVNCNIELYTERKSISMERTMERILKAHGLAYRKTSSWLDTEAMQYTLYETEILVNG